MKVVTVGVACLALAGTTLAARPATLQGTYVEARTAEVFAGGCVMNGEAGTTGREALLAWKVGHGQFAGVPLDGLAVVVAVEGDTNLGIHEIGGDVAATRAAVFTDARATAAQRQALVSMVKALSSQLVDRIVEVTPTPIEFVDGPKDVSVSTSTARLLVHKHMDHDPSCGGKQWFGPLSTVSHAEMGTTAENAFSGDALGTKWSDPDKHSSFFGDFAIPNR
jgi:hypothetical protein